MGWLARKSLDIAEKNLEGNIGKISDERLMKRYRSLNRAYHNSNNDEESRRIKSLQLKIVEEMNKRGNFNIEE